MEILGMIGMAIATVCVLLKILRMKKNEMIPKIAGVTAMVSGLVMILGAIVFATIERQAGFDLHAGFAMCIVAGTIAGPAGVVAVLNK